MGLQFKRVKGHDGRVVVWLQEHLWAHNSDWKPEAESTHGEWHDSFETSKAVPSDILPPTRPHLLILPNEFHQLGAKSSNLWAYGDHSHSNSYMPSVLLISQGMPRLFPYLRCCWEWNNKHRAQRPLNHIDLNSFGYIAVVELPEPCGNSIFCFLGGSSILFSTMAVITSILSVCVLRLHFVSVSPFVLSLLDNSF